MFCSQCIIMVILCFVLFFIFETEKKYSIAIWIRIDVIFSIELFEQFVLKTFAGQIATKPMPNASASSFQQVCYLLESIQFNCIMKLSLLIDTLLVSLLLLLCFSFRSTKTCSSLFNGLRVTWRTSTKAWINFSNEDHC